MTQHPSKELFKSTTRDELQPVEDLSRAKDILMYVFGKELQTQFRSVVEDRCNGCQIDHPSQLQHSCLWLEDDDWEVDSILEEALSKVDISYVKALSLETAKILHFER